MQVVVAFQRVPGNDGSGMFQVGSDDRVAAVQLDCVCDTAHPIAGALGEGDLFRAGVQELRNVSQCLVEGLVDPVVRSLRSR